MDDVPRRISATTAWMLGLHCFMFLLVCDFISFCVSKENSIAQETIDRPLQRVSREKRMMYVRERTISVTQQILNTVPTKLPSQEKSNRQRFFSTSANRNETYSCDSRIIQNFVPQARGNNPWPLDLSLATQNAPARLQLNREVQALLWHQRYQIAFRLLYSSLLRTTEERLHSISQDRKKCQQPKESSQATRMSS